MTEPTGDPPAPRRPASGPAHVGDEPEVVVRATAQDVSVEAAGRIAAALAAAIDERRRADLVTTGGSTPLGIYGALSALFRDALDWTRVHVWWGDDRYVPHDHPLSNVGPAPAIPTENLHPFPCNEAIARALGPAWCARRYVEELRASGLREARGFPAFDVILLGVGADGHILSVFPGSKALDSTNWAMAIPAPTHVEPRVERVTLNPAVLAVAGTILVVATGARKAAIVSDVFRTPRDVRKLPAQLVRRRGATWVLDREAAAGIPAQLLTIAG